MNCMVLMSVFMKLGTLYQCTTAQADCHLSLDVNAHFTPFSEGEEKWDLLFTYL